MHHDRHHHCHHQGQEGRDRCHHCGHGGGFRHEDERSGRGHCCCCRGCCRPCGGERGWGGRGSGRGFDEKRVIDTIVHLVTENVSREVERIIHEALESLHDDGSHEEEPSSCPECGK